MATGVIADNHIILYKFPTKNQYNNLFICFLIFTTLVSIFFGYVGAVNRFVADAEIPMFFCTSLVLFTSYFKRFPESLVIISATFFAFCIGYNSTDIVKLFFGTSLRGIVYWEAEWGVL